MSTNPAQSADQYACVTPDVKLGKDVNLGKFINLYGCAIGDETKIGAFVEIQKNASVGKRCKISSHTFVCEGVTIEDHVFVGHGVVFVNDSDPRATTETGELQTGADCVGVTALMDDYRGGPWDQGRRLGHTGEELEGAHRRAPGVSCPAW